VNFSLIRCESTEAVPVRADFITRFDAVGTEIRAHHPRVSVQPSSYLSLVLSVGFSRPAALFIVEGPDGAVARAGIFQGSARTRSGVIGLYEAAPDPDGSRAAELLMEAATEWAVAHDIEEIFAPVDVNTWFNYRIMVQRNERASAPDPFTWEPAASVEYHGHFLNHGFEVAASFETVGLHIPDDGEHTFGDLVARTRPGYEAAISSGLQIDRVRSEDIGAVLPELHALCTDAFEDNLLFESIPFEAFRALYGNAIAKMDGHLTFLARERGGRLVGFLFTFPDQDWLVLKTIAVASDVRGQGLGTALSHALYREAGQAGFRRLITALVREDNVSRLMLDPNKMPGVETWTRRYELLRWAVPSRTLQ